MTTKFDNFVAALEQLCVEHDVKLQADYDGLINVFDGVRDIFVSDLVDYTKEQ